MNKPETLESIDTGVLANVCGGTTPGEDLRNMVGGALRGAATGGPWGAIRGTIQGAIPGFRDAFRDLNRERQRGADLDRQREQMRQRHPEYFTNGRQ